MSEVKSGFRRLLELTDKSAREELNSYYIISESRMDNYLNCLEDGAKQIAELRAQLAEAQKEAYPAYKREKALRCKAEAENAELRERLKPVEKVYEKIEKAPDGLANTTYDFLHEMYFAICAACEGEKLE